MKFVFAFFFAEEEARMRVCSAISTIDLSSSTSHTHAKQAERSSLAVRSQLTTATGLQTSREEEE